MPGSGEFLLRAYGSQNAITNGNPQSTNFYKVFKTHMHFSQDNITIPMEGVNQLSMDNSVRIRAKIPRYGDLLTGLTFVFNLPAIYSKLYNDIESFRGNPSFRWIHQIGAHIIQNAAIYVGGTKIQEFPGEWLAVRASVDYPADAYQKWRRMVGDVPELNEPEWGAYGARPDSNYPYGMGVYPHATDSNAAPSIPATQIRVPLPFWFSESWGTALPLIALQLHEVEVQLTLRSVSDIIRLMAPINNTGSSVISSEPTRPNRQLVLDTTAPFTSYTVPPPTAYTNLTLQNAYSSWNDPIYQLANYIGPPGTTVTTNTFALNPHLEGNYIYVTGSEQRIFSTRELTYLVHQVQRFEQPSIIARAAIELDVHALLTRLIFFARRSDALASRNDYLGMANWKSLNQPPFVPSATDGPAVPSPLSATIDGTQTSGNVIPYYARRDILQSVRLLINGNEVYEEKPASFYSVEVPYHNTTGGGLAAGRPADVMGPLYQFPFALNGSDHAQPSGTANMSTIRQLQLEVVPAELDPKSYYVYDVIVYAETLNTIKFLSGLASVSWAT
jgi:hypothetical protein